MVYKNRPDLDIRIFTAIVNKLELDDLTIYHNLSIQDEEGSSLLEQYNIGVKHIGKVYPVTCIKDMYILELWNDRAVGVLPNTGKFLNQSRIYSVSKTFT